LRKVIKSCSVFIVEPDPDLQTLFRVAFKDWSHLICFCNSFKELKALLTGVRPDLVLCNIQLPGFIKEEFLRYIQVNCPHALRVVYSKKNNEESLLKIVGAGLAHRQFCLPLESSTCYSLEHDIVVRAKIRVRKCWDFIQKGQRLPSLPPLIVELEDLLKQPDYAMDDVVNIIKKDPVLCARLLQLVNSALFSKTNQISDLYRAILFLGISKTRKMVLFLCAIRHFQYPKKFHGHALRIINHSIQCGKLAGIIAHELMPEQTDTAVTAGLLHDIGKLVFLASLDGTLRNCSAFMENYGLYASKLENEVFGITHQELGSSLLIWWNFPFSLIDAAANHSQPLHTLDGVTKCVAIADRCLFMAMNKSMVTNDFDFLKNKFPVEKWMEFAHNIIKEDSLSLAV